MSNFGPEPSDAANRLADTIMRRIKDGLRTEGIEPSFTGLAQLIEVYLIAAREEGRQIGREDEAGLPWEQCD